MRVCHSTRGPQKSAVAGELEPDLLAGGEGTVLLPQEQVDHIGSATVGAGHQICSAVTVEVPQLGTKRDAASALDAPDLGRGNRLVKPPRLDVHRPGIRSRVAVNEQSCVPSAHQQVDLSVAVNVCEARVQPAV